MSNVILTLGGVPFRDMEVPEKISFGGHQRIAVQNIIGGRRVVEALGTDDGNISFSGIFSGTDAGTRAQMLDAARSLGALLPLAWDGFFYTVIVEEFFAEYRKHNLIRFSISCVVVSNVSTALIQPMTTVANLIVSDLGGAGVLSGQAGIPLGGGGTMSIAGLSLVQEAVSAAIAVGGDELNTALFDMNRGADPNSGVLAFEKVAETSSQLAALSGMSGYVNRAASNLLSELL